MSRFLIFMESQVCNYIHMGMIVHSQACNADLDHHNNISNHLMQTVRALIKIHLLAGYWT